MFIRKGKNRLAVVFPAAGFALKFPLVHAWRATKHLFRYGFNNPYPGEISKSLTEHLFQGMGDNLREYRFYHQTKHPFLQPTYASFFGLLNIQRTTKPCALSMQALWQEFHDITGGEAFKDAHHFSSPLNFCHDNSRLMILDYGHLKTQEIIQKYGDKLYRCQHGVCLHPVIK